MPINPFSPQNQPEENIKRNDFDLSNSSVFTTDFFKLYPAFCKEVLPGDTFEIDFQLGVRGMPTVFPVQTKMRMSMEFYYVRNRTLHDKFEDMIFKTKDVEHPWLRLTRERAKVMISTGSLGDALGVPTTRYSDETINYFKTSLDMYKVIALKSTNMKYDAFNPESFLDDKLNQVLRVYDNVPQSRCQMVGYFINIDYNLTDYRLYTEPAGATGSPLNEHFYLLLVDGDNKVLSYVKPRLNGDVDSGRYYIDFSNFAPFINASIKGGFRLFFALNFFGTGTTVPNYAPGTPSWTFFGDMSNYSSDGQPSSRTFTAFQYLPNFVIQNVFDATDDSVISQNQFIGDNPEMRLNVLPFRAYEQICNYYYRNDKNNPYYLNGEPQYNEFIPTHASGPDDNVYDFHYRNWELDCFTSAQQSPQFGDAPLVGLTWQGSNDVELEFQATNTETSEVKNYKVRVGLDDDDNVDSILDFSPDVPSADLQRLQRRIQAGLSINDLRVTNSFQRFLENTMRRGLRYRNQLKSHFGVSVDYPDIDVPQYIGGFSSNLDTGQVTNMADSPNAGLGDYIGTLQGSMQSQNTIRQYCPEHGFIIGIFSMSPVPSYPQSINPFMLHDGPMTYYQTEFRHIGFVPIRHKVLDPLQTPENGSVNDVFGYQMANYEYKRSLDEVHGDFRTTLRDWVLTRTFKNRPTLTESFTVGKPEQLNDVFVTQNIADAYGSNAKFLCSARFHCVALRQIPIVGTPALE